MKASKTGTKVILEFDIDETGRDSATGKNKVNYTTGGFDWTSLPGFGINLTIIKSKR